MGYIHLFTTLCSEAFYPVMFFAMYDLEVRIVTSPSSIGDVYCKSNVVIVFTDY